MSTPDHSPLLSVSVKQAAAMTSIGEFVLRDAINRGDLPALRVGERRIAILVTELEAWLKGHPRVVA